MTIIEQLKHRIKSLNTRIEQSSKLLKDVEEGTLKISFLAQASAESSIEKNTFLLNKYTQKLKKLSLEDINDVNEKEKTKEEIRLRNYFKYQIQRIRRDTTRTEKEKNNALLIIEDIPEKVQLEDEDIFEIGNKSKELFLDIHTNLDDDLLEIKNEFLGLVENEFDENNHELKLLNYRIPIIILQLRTLLHNVHENIKESNLNNFKGFPKFQDWWIEELWVSHQAYLALFKWKRVVLSLLLSCEQRKSFENIFTNWILVKKILNLKGKNGYAYNHAFDQMIHKYAELEEEQNESHLLSLKNIVAQGTIEKNLEAIKDKNILINGYTKFKIEKAKEK